MNRIVVIIALLVCALGLQAQSMSRSFDEIKQRQQERFNKIKSEQQAEYDAFRKEINERYAEFMRKNWEQFNAYPAVQPKEEKKVAPVIYQDEQAPVVPQPDQEPQPAPVQPEQDIAVQPVDTVPVIAPKEEPKSEPIPVKEEVIRLPAPKPAPQPIAPVQPKEEIAFERVSINYYGTTMAIGFPKDVTFKLKGVSENDLASAWKELSGEQYDITISDALACRKKFALCDWAYLCVLQEVAEKKYGKTNEAVLMQAYLLSQSGYKMRLAYDENKRLYVLIASQYNILSMSYYMIDGAQFYPLNCESQRLNICKASFDKEQSISLQINKEQKLKANFTEPRKLTSKYGVVTEVSVNTNNISFYNNYPSAYLGDNATTRWVVYANTPLEKSISSTLYPTLKKSIEGLDERSAVNKILNFVQTAFEYEYDDKVWGGDRVFFATETLHYPYADCEDRSILFARLVRDLMNLDVVLIYYPGHLATAVGFTQEVNGDYLTYRNKKYIVCDPTYIGAPVGRTMPGMNNQQAQVIVL